MPPRQRVGWNMLEPKNHTASYGTDFPMSTLYMSTCFLNGGKILNQVCGLLWKIRENMKQPSLHGGASTC